MGTIEVGAKGRSLALTDQDILLERAQGASITPPAPATPSVTALASGFAITHSLTEPVQAISTSADADDIIDLTGHGFANGDRVKFTSKTGGSSLATEVIYFVINAAANTFQLSAVPAGTALNFGSDITAGNIGRMLPLAVAGLAVHISTSSGFAPSQATRVGTIDAQSAEQLASTNPELRVNVETVADRYIKVVAYTTDGKESAASAQAGPYNALTAVLEDIESSTWGTGTQGTNPGGDSPADLTLSPNNWMELDGTGDYANSDYTAAFAAAGEVRVEALIRAADYTPSSTMFLGGRWGSTNTDKHHRVGFATGGHLVAEAAYKRQFLDGWTGAAGEVAQSTISAITGDIDVRAMVTSDNWDDSTRTIACQWNDTNNRSHLFRLLSGIPSMYCSINGTATDRALNGDTNVTTVATDGQPLWLRATVDIDNGSSQCEAKFYYATSQADADADSWTQLGSTITGTNFANFYNATCDFNVGWHNDGPGAGTQYWNGDIYWVEWRSGIGGTVIADPHFDDVAEWPDDGPNDDGTGNTWTLGHANLNITDDTGSVSIYTLTSSATLASAVTGLTDDTTDVWVAYTLEPNVTGSLRGRFYWATDAAKTWTELGTAQTTTPHHVSNGLRLSTKALRIGEDNGGDWADYNGRVYDAAWYNNKAGATGDLIANPKFNRQDPGDTSFTDNQTNTWTLTNAQIWGAETGYYLDDSAGTAQFKRVFGAVDIFTAADKETLQGLVIAEEEYTEAATAVTGSWADVISQTFSLTYSGETVDILLEGAAYLTDLGENETIQLRLVVVDDSGTNTGSNTGGDENPNSVGSVSTLAVSGTSLFASGNHDHFGSATGGTPGAINHTSSNHSLTGSPGVTVSDKTTRPEVRELFKGMTAAGSTVTVKLQAIGTNYTGTPSFSLYARAKRQLT